MNPLYEIENNAQIARLMIPPFVVGIILTYLWLIHHFWLREGSNEEPASQPAAVNENGTPEAMNLTNGFAVKPDGSPKASISKVLNRASGRSGTVKEESLKEREPGGAPGGRALPATEPGMDLAA